MMIALVRARSHEELADSWLFEHSPQLAGNDTWATHRSATLLLISPPQVPDDSQVRSKCGGSVWHSSHAGVLDDSSRQQV
mmetsp:Transcript_761/g.1827  ORF Transcript_761/g.1827 Transcript_761/m.1827 type:complete len:80 (-) Transcript_761:108-347(-)